MRNNTEDKTIEKNLVQKYRFLIREYELIKEKKSSRYKFVGDFYKAHDTNRQTFLKYYHRFKTNWRPEDLLPRKRWPKWHTRKPIKFIEEKVLEQRRNWINRYEIHTILKDKLKQFTPSPSGIYNICKRYNLHKLKPKMKENERKIIKEIAWELWHIDCHYLPKWIIENDNKRYYLVALVDSCSRITWAEVIEDLKSITVMFAVMRCFQVLQNEFNIKFEEVITDNWPEFSGRWRGLNQKALNEKKGNLIHHPFERLLIEMEIKHRYTRPYRPQTNWKVERFWRTIEEDMLEDTSYESLEQLKEELLQYLIYFNHKRPHQWINGLAPVDFLRILSAN